MRPLSEDELEELAELALARLLDEHAALQSGGGFVARAGHLIALELDGSIQGWAFPTEEEASGFLAEQVDQDAKIYLSSDTSASAFRSLIDEVRLP